MKIMKLSDKNIKELKVGDLVVSCVTGCVGVICEISKDTTHPDCPYDPIDNDYLIGIFWISGNKSVQPHKALVEVNYIEPKKP